MRRGARLRAAVRLDARRLGPQPASRSRVTSIQRSSRKNCLGWSASGSFGTGSRRAGAEGPRFFAITRPRNDCTLSFRFRLAQSSEQTLEVFASGSRLEWIGRIGWGLRTVLLARPFKTHGFESRLVVL